MRRKHVSILLSAVVAAGMAGCQFGPDPIVGTWVTELEKDGSVAELEMTFEEDHGFDWTWKMRMGESGAIFDFIGTWERVSDNVVRFTAHTSKVEGFGPGMAGAQPTLEKMKRELFEDREDRDGTNVSFNGRDKMSFSHLGLALNFTRKK